MNKIQHNLPDHVYNACLTLFNGDCSNIDKILADGHPELNQAYRDMMFHYHPDRSKLLGLNSDLLTEKSKEINESYETLKNFIDSKKTRDRIQFKFRNSTGSKPNKFSYKYTYRDRTFLLPRTKLTLGRFIYYLGIINFNTLVASLTWLKSERPIFGKMAMELGYLKEDQLKLVYQNKKKDEQFGSCAVRLGFITEEELNTILEHQKSLEPDITEYFINNGILEESEMEDLVYRNNSFNRTIEGSQ